MHSPETGSSKCFGRMAAADALYVERMLSCLCRMLMGRDVGFEDLRDVNPDVYASLKKLLAFEGDFSELGLVFQVCLTLSEWP